MRSLWPNDVGTTSAPFIPHAPHGILFAMPQRKRKTTQTPAAEATRPLPFDVARGDQSMVTGWVGASLAVMMPLILSRGAIPTSWGYFYSYAFVGLVAIITTMAVVDHVVQRRVWGLGPRPHALNGLPLLLAALVRWLAWLGLLGVAAAFYNIVAHYRQDFYGPFRSALPAIIAGWLVLGFPYYLWTLRRRWGLRWDLNDPAVWFAILGRRILRQLRRRRPVFAAMKPLFAGKHARAVALGLLVKAFFIPVMLSFFFYNSRDFVESTVNLIQVIKAGDLWGTRFYVLCNALFTFLYSGMYMADITLATIGYLVTTRWLDNGIKSVDTTALGWLSCLACYRPFNDITSGYFPWPPMRVHDMPDSALKLVLMAGILVTLAIYVYATIAFGLRFSNLTNRGVFTRGPYRWVRHPAYASKSLSWWFEYLPGMASFQHVLFMLAWNGIYLTRALTEERHLGTMAKYRTYCTIVRWRFIPKLF